VRNCEEEVEADARYDDCSKMDATSTDLNGLADHISHDAKESGMPWYELINETSSKWCDRDAEKPNQTEETYSKAKERVRYE
jgi:hypothetical protein